MKTVLFIIDSLNCGGAEKSLVSLLPHLDYSQVDVSLSIVCRGGVFEQYLPTQVRLIPFPELSPVGRFFSNALLSVSRRVLTILGTKRHGAELAWICKRRFVPVFKEHFDVAVAYQQGFPTYFLADKVNADKKIAWINTDLENAGYRLHFNRPFYDRMNCVCAVSDALCEKLSFTGFVNKEQLTLVKDILPVDLIRKMATEPLAFDFVSDRPLVLTVGRMVPPKNYPLAIETARFLSKKGVPFTWVFVGEGAERKDIERRIERYHLSDSVIVAGRQINPYPFFKCCDIYVQTSSFEGFGLTLSEAKILHKPIVTTNFPSAYDQITDGENGLITEMTPESLADGILRLIDNPSLKEKLVNATRQEDNLTAITESKLVNHLLLDD